MTDSWRAKNIHGDDGEKLDQCVCTYELVTAISPMKKYAAVLKSSCKRYGVQWDGRKHHTPLYDATKAAELFCQLPRVPDAARVKGVLECICNT